MEKLINARTVAMLLEVSVSAVHRLCVRGTLNYRLVAGRRLFVREDVLQLLVDSAYQLRTRAKRGAK